MLPALREELRLFPGPSTPGGAPSWTLHDPVRNRFFRFDWRAFEILSRWSLAVRAAIVAAVNDETTLGIEEADVDGMLRFLVSNQLIRVSDASAVGVLVTMADAERRSPFQWLLHHYLFFRIPLLRPDRLLERGLATVGWLGGRAFIGATVAAVVVGLFLIHRQWDLFRATLVDTLTPSGLLGYGAALASTKIVHELAHGFVAKSRGCRVPTMGIAFLVMWPVLYTDVTDVWKLPDKRSRLRVNAAGILAEMTIAAWCTLLWAFLPDGGLRQSAFLLCTTTWISSLLVNLSPFMRFDGYFLVMDALDLPNLHARAFSQARWWMRESLFGLGEDPPEPFSRGTRLCLVAFAFAVWIYRLVLFTGVAVLVYHFFIKLIGVALFFIEIGWFVARPVIGELSQWLHFGSRLGRHRRSRITGLAFLSLVALLGVPWQGRVVAPAVLKAPRTVGIYPPAASRLVDKAIDQGTMVTQGMTLAVLDSPDVEGALAKSRARYSSVRYQLDAVAFDSKLKEQSLALVQALAAEEAATQGLEAQKSRLRIVAPFDGVIVDVLPDLHGGDWLAPQERLATLKEGKGEAVVEAYVAEDELARIVPGANAVFIPDAPGWPERQVRVLTVESSPVHVLSDVDLATIHGGALSVRGKGRALVPDGALYRIRLSAGADEVPVRLRGRVTIDGSMESLGARWLRAAATVVVREWGG